MSTSRKGWSLGTLARLGVTRDGDRFVIPVHGDDGELRAVLRYADNGADPKMLAGKGDTRDLFPAPETVRGSTLYVVEGEPDAITMAELGLPAVSYPGVGKWSPDWTRRLALDPAGELRERVVIVPDCDDVGRRRARAAAAKIAAFGVPAFVAELDRNRDDGYDIGDVLVDLGEDIARGLVAVINERAERVGPGRGHVVRRQAEVRRGHGPAGGARRQRRGGFGGVKARPLASVPRLLLTRQEAAASMGMSVDHFERFVQPYVRLVRAGQKRLVSVRELERWIEQQAHYVHGKDGATT